MILTNTVLCGSIEFIKRRSSLRASRTAWHKETRKQWQTQTVSWSLKMLNTLTSCRNLATMRCETPFVSQPQAIFLGGFTDVTPRLLPHTTRAQVEWFWFGHLMPHQGVTDEERCTRYVVWRDVWWIANNLINNAFSKWAEPRHGNIFVLTPAISQTIMPATTLLGKKEELALEWTIR